MLIDDIRRAALARLQSWAMTHWAAKIGGQGEMAGEAMTHLGLAALRHGSAQHQTTLVHVATHSIECLWLENAGGRSSLHRLRCGPCDCHLSLSHLADCPSGWLRVNSRLELGALLLCLFHIAASAPAKEQCRHLTRLIDLRRIHKPPGNRRCQVTRIGFDPAEAGRASLRQLCLLCLEHIENVFSDRKEIARA
jgi:hypothetical protein